MKKLCVFCGAKSGNMPEYIQSAEALAKEMGKRGINLGMERPGRRPSPAGIAPVMIPSLCIVVPSPH